MQFNDCIFLIDTFLQHLWCDKTICIPYECFYPTKLCIPFLHLWEKLYFFCFLWGKPFVLYLQWGNLYFFCLLWGKPFLLYLQWGNLYFSIFYSENLLLLYRLWGKLYFFYLIWGKLFLLLSSVVSFLSFMRKTVFLLYFLWGKLSSLGKSIFSLSSVGKTAFHSIFSDESANQEWDKEEQNAKTYERDDNY